ncbi:MAG TPA: hypothetical protein VIS06_01885 [Mycobacteriales bacterium]
MRERSAVRYAVRVRRQFAATPPRRTVQDFRRPGAAPFALWVAREFRWEPWSGTPPEVSVFEPAASLVAVAAAETM